MGLYFSVNIFGFSALQRSTNITTINQFGCPCLHIAFLPRSYFFCRKMRTDYLGCMSRTVLTYKSTFRKHMY